MYKILVIIRDHSMHGGVCVHTQVIEFNDKDSAIFAADKIKEAKTSLDIVKVIQLF